MNNSYLIGMSKDLITTPALVVDADILENNIEKMMEYLNKKKMNIRPHTKTHKTPMIGHMQKKAGAIGLCCTTIKEAEEMVYAGIKGVLIANEVVTLDKIRRVVGLAQFSDIMIAVEDIENLKDISAEAVKRSVKVGVLVDLDVGMGRCGVRSIEDAVNLAKKANELEGITFRGIMGYEGHAVFVNDRKERTEAGVKANKHLVEAARAIESSGIPVEIVSGAGTGTYDIASEVDGMTEIQAGSYIFMDLTYAKLGLPFDQSLSVLTTVISHPVDEIIIMDAGIKSLSVERELPKVQETDKITIEKLSEEHAKGLISDPSVNIKVGDKLNLIPSHCCSTMNLYDEIYLVRNGIIEGILPVSARGNR